MSNRGNNVGIERNVAEEEEVRVDNEALTEEQVQNNMLAHEEDFIQGLIDAADFAISDDEQRTIEIARPVSGSVEKKVFFKFTIHALHEGDYEAAKKKHTKYVKNKQFGMKLPDEVNSTRYRAQLIYMATVDEDRAKLWDNKTVWDALKKKGLVILNALDVIENTLKAGEKDKVIEILDEISGYDSNIEEAAKN